MLKKDMEVGRAYCLYTGLRETKVTMLETPEELRGKARVKVRFETGIKKGQVSDVASHRIVCPWDGPAPTRAKPPAASPRVVEVQRPPEVGDQVLWEEETGEIPWTLDAIGGGAATIAGNLFGQPRTATVPLVKLKVAPVTLRPEGAPSVPWMQLDEAPRPETRRRAPRSAEHLAPERPKREFDVLLDNLIFSPACLRQYQQRYLPRQTNVNSSEHLRKQLRGGYLERLDSDGYGKVCVLNKFEIPLPFKPTEERPLTVNHLNFVGGRRNRKRHGRRRSRAA